MQGTELLKRQIGVAQRLFSLVKTMKALAAASIREYELTVASVNAYYRTVETGLQIYLRNIAHPVRGKATETAGGTALVVLGSDQGLCGQFNERIARFAWQALESINLPPSECPVLAVGSRVVGPLKDYGFTVADCQMQPVTPRGFGLVLQNLLLKMDALQESHAIHRFFLFHNQPRSAATFESGKKQLLPFELAWILELKDQPWPNRCLPTFTLDPERMFSTLVRQYLSVQLDRALAESLMSENVARLAAMQQAENNIDERLEILNRQYHELRQTGITEELLDIVTGFEAIAQTRPSPLPRDSA